MHGPNGRLQSKSNSDIVNKSKMNKKHSHNNSHNNNNNNDNSNEIKDNKNQVNKYRTVFFDRRSALVRVEARYLPLEVIGAGAYGIVCGAKDLRNGRKVAIKKIERVYMARGIAKRTLRELIILRHLRGHENIIYLHRVMRPHSIKKHKDIYLVSDLMETDLACVIRSNQALSDDHVQFFLYQILRAVKYMHSAGIIHRDLKPRNLLVNSNCDLQICDFGLARIDSMLCGIHMSDYVATRWYRSPEIIRRKRVYGKPLDMWSIGCIMAELIGRKPIFNAQNEVHLLYLIKNLLGEPKTSDEKSPRERLRDLYPNITETALDLLYGLLRVDPKKRLTVEEALEHPYLAELHDIDDEPTCPPIDPRLFEAFEGRRVTIDDIRDRIVNEILENYPEDNVDYFVNEPSIFREAPPNDKKAAARRRRHSK